MPVNWMENLVEKHATVLYKPSRIIGKVVKLYTPDEPYLSPLNGKPVVASHVLELQGGHAFLAKNEEDFVVLDEKSVRYALQVQGTLEYLLIECSKLGAAMQVESHVACDIIVAALNRQARALALPASRG